MRIKDKINQFFFLEDDEMEFDETDDTSSTEKETDQRNNAQLAQRSQTILNRKTPSAQTGSLKQSETNVVSINQRPSSQKPKIKVVEPRTYSEVRGIADLVLNNYTVLLNFRRIEKDQARKVLDFLMGTVYAIDGDIQRIGEEIFVCTPSNVEIDGTELEVMSSKEYY